MLNDGISAEPRCLLIFSEQAYQYQRTVRLVLLSISTIQYLKFNIQHSARRLLACLRAVV